MVYAFPPFSIIPRVLEKVQMEQVKIMILIGPTWQGQPWYSETTISDFYHFKATSISDFLEKRSSENFIGVNQTLTLTVWITTGDI